ncbi:hypothetical protein BGHDH14_bgh02198 [Blumeria hordei DH14]|uniref:DUF1746 domain-containing protein n=1 Tax=Blumeria graminis f. sp. hordei (strain DH14) TaxID=546991 RepID=N1JE91_BLUG1|nr:hypothetical protein BGHDH14_bgh02198 [Blumeria hordei DH14]
MENDPPPTELHATRESYRRHYDTNDVFEPTQRYRRRQYVLSSAQKITLARAKKKIEFLTNLLTNLDTLIYIELCVVYYMDCSLFRLLLRFLNQMIFFTPKPVPRQRPYIGAIFVPGIICMLLHLFTARSEASEAMRGYLHGGVIIDLIGQKGPTSKIHLLTLDIILLMLQCFMLAVHVEKGRLQIILATVANPRTEVVSPRADVVNLQDHDVEERGLIRNENLNDADIELQNITVDSLSNNHDQSLGVNRERERLLSDYTARTGRESEEDEYEEDETLEMFWSGMAIVSDFHILDNLKKQWHSYGCATRTGHLSESSTIDSNHLSETTRYEQDFNSLHA